MVSPIRIASEASGDTKVSRAVLSYLVNTVHAWRADPRDYNLTTDLYTMMKQVSAQLSLGVWLASDIDTLKETLFIMGDGFLQMPTQKSDHMHQSTQLTRRANEIATLLWQYGWWQEWTDNPKHHYAFAALCLLAYNIEPPGYPEPGIATLVQNWHKKGKTQAEATGNAPTLTVEQLAETFFGPSWVVLYGDLLTKPFTLVQHLRDVQPQLAWAAQPVRAADKTPTVTLPADIGGPESC